MRDTTRSRGSLLVVVLLAVTALSVGLGGVTAEQTGQSAPAEAEVYLGANPADADVTDASHVVTLTVGNSSAVVGQTLGEAGDELVVGYNASGAVDESTAALAGNVVERIDENGTVEQLSGLDAAALSENADGDLVVSLNGTGALGPVEAGDKLRVVLTGVDNTALADPTAVDVTVDDADGGVTSATFDLELGAHDGAIVVEGGAGPTAWASFQQAIENGVAGADGATATLPNTTINEVDRQPTLAASGLLNAQVGSADGLTVQGEDDTTVVSSAAGQTRFVLWNKQNADNITIDNVGFDGDDELAGPAAQIALSLQTTDGTTVANSTFESFSTAALSGQGNLTVTDNTVDNQVGGGVAVVTPTGATATVSGNDIDVDGSVLPVPDIFIPGDLPLPVEELPVENGGIGVVGAGQAVITDNTIDGAETTDSIGVGLLGSVSAEITGTTVQGTAIGVGTQTSGALTVANVTVTGSERGFRVGGQPATLTVEDNVVVGTGNSTGLSVLGAGQRVAVLDNELRNHSTGLAFRSQDAGADYRIQFNDIRNNEVGVAVNTSGGFGRAVPVTFNDIVSNGVAVAVSGGDEANLGANYWGTGFGPGRPATGNSVTLGGDVVGSNRDTGAVNYAPALSAPVETLSENGKPLPTDEWILLDDPQNPFAVDDAAAPGDDATVAVVFVPGETTPDLDDPANYPDLVVNSSPAGAVAIDNAGARGSLAANELLRVNVSSEVAGGVELAATSAGFPGENGGTEFISSKSFTQTFSQQPAAFDVSVEPGTLRADGEQRAVVRAALEDSEGDRIDQTGAAFAWATEGPTVDERRNGATYDGVARLSLAATEGGEQITVEGGLLGTTLQLETTIDTVPRVSFDSQALGTRGGEPTVVVQSVDTAGQPGAVIVTYGQSGDPVVAGLTNGTFDNESVPVTIADTGGFPGEHTAHVVPVDQLSGEYQPGDTVSGATAEAIADNETATVFDARLRIDDQSSKGPADQVTVRTADLLDGGADSEFSAVVHPTREAQPVTAFTATASRGFITIDGNNPTDGQIPFTGADINGTVRIDGVVYSNGTWQSTNVEFPSIDPQEIVDGIDQIPAGAEIDINVTVPPIEGTYDPTAGLLTAPLTLEISVEGSFLGQTLIDVSAAPSATLTTGQSGTVTGTATGLATATPNATLVANEFPIEATGNDLADSQLGLPSPAGQNWLQLELGFDIANPGALDGVSRRETVPVLDETLGQSATLTGANDNVTVDLDEPVAESQEVAVVLREGPSTPPVVAADGETLRPVVDPATVTVVPQVDLNDNGQNATDTTGDGLLNDVDGDGDFDTVDVQALFDALGDPTVRKNTGFFDFGAGVGDEVTVLDVQGLFNRLPEQDR